MIIGTGVDLIEIERVTAATTNEHFNQRVFTAAELQESKRQGIRLAGYFAAKEALLKAMGTGLAGFSWQEVEIMHDPQGAPYFGINGKIKQFIASRKVSRIHLSISHCQSYAIAQVILEAEANQ